METKATFLIQFKSRDIVNDTDFDCLSFFNRKCQSYNSDG